MIQFLKDIRVLVWDFDGTFYRPNPALWHTIREAEYRVIVEHTGWSRKKVIGEFKTLHRHPYVSATEVSAKLSGISIVEAAVEMEQYFDRRKYVSRDEKLVKMFTELKQFRHITLANGVRAKHVETLRALGVSPKIFELMVTSETVGITKPDPAGFEYVLNHTQLPAAQHLMIGDRQDVDLAPAKALGMRTCLVWSKAEKLRPGSGGSSADISLPTVYDVAKALL